MGKKVRAVAVTSDVTYVDGRAASTPDGWAAQGPGEFLNRLATRAAHEMTVLVDAGAARMLGMPAGNPDIGPEMDAHPSAVAARAAGWKVREIGAWSTFTATDRPTIRVGVMPLINPVKMGLAAATLADTTANLAEWYDRTGSAFHGTPGAAGSAILAAIYPKGARRKGALHPSWKPLRPFAGGQVAAGPLDAAEDDYRITHWRARRAGTRWAHGYDANRAYVSACTTLRVCPWELKRTGRRAEWSPDRAGWWEVDLPPWNVPHMPDPSGYDPLGEGRAVRWVTGPTLELLTQLQDQGIYGGWRILDSWTGPAKDVLKPWAGVMRTAWEACERARCQEIKAGGLADDDLCQVCAAVKDSGRATLGLFNRASNWIYRPDWYYANIAQQRTNLWRRAWKVGGGPNGRGPWPLWIDVDNLWYGSDIEDPRVACPEGLKIGPGFGQFKPKASRKTRHQGER